MLKSQSLAPTDFDWQQLRQLAGEDAEFEAELLAMFLQDAANSLRRLEQAIATGDIQSVEEIAHSLRGASANVGASAIARAAYQLEQAARNGRLSDAPSLLQQLERHCQRIQTQLQVRR